MIGITATKFKRNAGAEEQDVNGKLSATEGMFSSEGGATRLLLLRLGKIPTWDRLDS